jgi:hypothetical protein
MADSSTTDVDTIIERLRLYGFSLDKLIKTTIELPQNDEQLKETIDKLYRYLIKINLHITNILKALTDNSIIQDYLIESNAHSLNSTIVYSKIPLEDKYNKGLLILSYLNLFNQFNKNYIIFKIEPLQKYLENLNQKTLNEDIKKEVTEVVELIEYILKQIGKITKIINDITEKSLKRLREIEIPTAETLDDTHGVGVNNTEKTPTPLENAVTTDELDGHVKAQTTDKPTPVSLTWTERAKNFITRRNTVVPKGGKRKSRKYHKKQKKSRRARRTRK